MDIEDELWHERALTAVENFSRTWGGAGFILVPTDGNTIDKVFWNILLSYDADYLWIARSDQNVRSGGLAFSEELLRELKIRLAPFHYDEGPLPGNVARGSLQNLLIRGNTQSRFAPRYPYTDVTSLLRYFEDTKQIGLIKSLDGIMRLWVGSTLGLIKDENLEAFEANGIRKDLIDFTGAQGRLFEIVVRGVHRELEVDNCWFPFAFSKLGLASYRSLKFPDWQEATVVVVGESIVDFCLYFSLSRMRRKIAWLLPSWLPDLADEPASTEHRLSDDLYHFSRSVDALASDNQQDSSVFFISTSLQSDQIESLRELFRKSLVADIQSDFPGDATTFSANSKNHLAESVEFLLKHPFRLFERGNVDKIISRHFIGDEMAGFFETPIPKNFLQIAERQTWVTDFSTIEQHIPRHPLLGKHIVRDSIMFESHARVGRDSVAYIDPHTNFLGGDMDSWLRKPRICLPDALDIFELLLGKIGYQTSISDKGRYALNVINKFGSLSTLANFLLAKPKIALLQKYIREPRGTKSAGDDSLGSEGIFLKSDQRVYLDLNAVENAVGNQITASTLIYYLIGISVLHRGMILKCRFCRGTDWFGLTDLTRSFICKRCSLDQSVGSKALGGAEPRWYYKLDEIVYKALTQNFVTPILATDYLRENSTSFDFSPELELMNPRTQHQMMELDLCCIQDGKITIGEAKSSERLAKTEAKEIDLIRRYYDLSLALGASQVVFATSKDAWRDKTLDLITARFESSVTKLIILGRKELYRLRGTDL